MGLDLADVILEAIDNELDGVFTSLVGRVTAYDATKQMVTVQPLSKFRYYNQEGDRVTESYPSVQGVPLMFPGSGAFRITWPVASGDIVLLVCLKDSADKWKAGDGGEAEPLFDDRHSLANSVAIPGLFSFGNVPTTAPTSAFVIHSTSDVLIGSPSANDPVARKSDLDAVVSALNGHTHAGPFTGATDTPLPQATAPDCSNKVKLD